MSLDSEATGKPPRLPLASKMPSYHNISRCHWQHPLQHKVVIQSTSGSYTTRLPPLIPSSAQFNFAPEQGDLGEIRAIREHCTPIYHRGETLKLSTWHRRKPSVSRGRRRWSRVHAARRQLRSGSPSLSHPEPRGRRASAQSLQKGGSRGRGSLWRPPHPVPSVPAAVATLGSVLLHGSRLLWPPASRASRSLRAAALSRARARGGDARGLRALRVRAASRAGRPGPGACLPGRARRPRRGFVLQPGFWAWRSRVLSRCREVTAGKHRVKGVSVSVSD